MFAKIQDVLTRLHEDERGDIPVGTLLLIALIVLPLLFLLIRFREKIVEFFQGEQKAVIDEGKKNNRPPADG